MTEIPPVITIRATYPSTDGTSPEEIAVEIPPGTPFGMGLDVLIDHIVKTLTDVPARARNIAYLAEVKVPANTPH